MAAIEGRGRPGNAGQFPPVGLRENRFLVQQPVDVYGQVRKVLDERRPTHWGERALRSFFQHELAIGGLDEAVTAL